MAEIWERQQGETTKAYAAFCVYRDLGPDRSLEKVRKEYEKNGKKISVKFLGRWSAKYNWVERARAYDDYLDYKKREEQEKAIRDMAERHAKVAMLFQQKVLERLQGINPSELSPADLARWLDVATKLERLSRGKPTEIGKQEVMLPTIVEVITDEENTDSPSCGPEQSVEE